MKSFNKSFMFSTVTIMATVLLVTIFFTKDMLTAALLTLVVRALYDLQMIIQKLVEKDESKILPY